MGVVFFSVDHLDRVHPTLQRNTWLRLPDGSMATITSAHLQLTDPDTAASNLTFVLTRLPRHGQLLLRGVAIASLPATLTQRDVDRMDVSYQHDPASPEDEDSFSFLPSDGSNSGFLQFGRLSQSAATFTIQVSSYLRVPHGWAGPAAGRGQRSDPASLT